MAGFVGAAVSVVPLFFACAWQLYWEQQSLFEQAGQ
jgi:hypothetical protein